MWHGEGAVAHHRLVALIENANRDALAWFDACRVVGNRRLDVTVAIDVRDH